MKEILVATLGSGGDVNPKIALARALKARGHTVSLASNGTHRDKVLAAGLDYVELGSAKDYQDIMSHPDLWHPRRAFPLLARRGILPLMRPFYEELASRDPARTAVIASGLLFGARPAHENLGMTWISAHLQPSVIMSLDDTPEIAPPFTSNRLPRWFRRAWFGLANRLFIDRLLGPEVNAFRRELGLASISDFFGEAFHSPELVLGLWDERFAAPVPDWPSQVRITGFLRYDGSDGENSALPGEIEAFLKDGPAPIVFTPGTANVQARRFFEAAVDACRRLGRRGLLMTPFRDQVPEALPEGVAQADYAPFGLLLPRSAALVYHGGVGSLAQAMAAGIPHLVMPMAHDQPDNARRLKRMGIGDFIAPWRFTGARVAQSLDRLLGDERVAERCRALAPTIDFEGNANRAVEEIERLIGSADSL